MDDTTHLKMPYIMAAQAQKHVTHNEALRGLDAIVQLAVKDRDLGSPPSSPSDGDRYIVATGATGTWQGHDGEVAAWQDNAWMFYTMRQGWLAWIADEEKLTVWDGSNWSEVSGAGSGSVNPASLVGVNTVADTENRLSVSSENTLLSHEGADHRVKINKASLGDTASLLFQDDWSGRAEMGLTGDDDFHFKVSADGSTWKEAIIIDRSSGATSFPNTRFLTDYSANLLQDSGRFHANGTGISTGPFVKPAYLTEINSSTLTEHGHFIQDNNDYGGVAGVLNADVKDLVDKIRHPSFRRYGIEFYVGKLTMGSGQGGIWVVNGTNFYESLLSQQVPRYAASTFHLYMRAKTGNVGVKAAAGQTIYFDGVEQSFPASLTPLDGWKSVRITDYINPYSAYGYTPTHLDIYQDTVGGEVLLACPALLPGITDVDINSGVFASYNIWQA